MVYLMDDQLLLSARVQLMSEVLGCLLSEGTLYQTRQACFELLGEVEADIVEALQQAEVAHFDETGLRVNGSILPILPWLIRGVVRNKLLLEIC
jgi:transposase